MLKAEFCKDINSITVRLAGDIDHHGAKNCRERIDQEVSQSFPKTLVLDFEKVDFIDSSAVGMIMGRYKLMSSIGGELRVRNLNKRCLKLLRLSGVANIVKLEEK